MPVPPLEGSTEAFRSLFTSLVPAGLTEEERAQLLLAVSELSPAQRVEIDTWLEAHYAGVFDLGRVDAMLPLPAEPTLAALASRVVRNGFARVPDRPGESRHALNTRLSGQDWTDVRPTRGAPVYRWNGSEVVVLAFEGTGAFEPRLAPGIRALTHTLQAAGYDTSRLQPATLIEEALRGETGAEPRWSGLAHGLRTCISRDRDLERRIQWLSFPSEELEMLAHPDAFRNQTAEGLVGDILRSSRGRSRGIENARDAMRSILRQAHFRGEAPTFVVVSHSSGGRSTVKFLELAKEIRSPGGAEPQIALAFTIDPVREAHEALGEAARELFNKGTEHNVNWVRRQLGLREERVWPPTLRSREQPESLYRVGNVPRWVNFFQRSDTEGLKINPRFGIHGSPIRGAENLELHRGPDLGDAGHGEIAYHPAVLDRFGRELARLLP